MGGQLTKGLPYKKAMWRHLAEYKLSALGVRSNGIWKKNRKEYAHILPFEHQTLNILKPYREEFWDFFPTAKITLHSDFHHLSSSQAMCFNFFFPFLAEGKKHLQSLREVFGTSGVVKDGRFEVILNDAEATNFDFCIFADSKKLFEVKLTEEGFGAAAPNESHFSKFRRVYSPALTGKFKAQFCSLDVFLRHYQLMRNVWNLEPSTADGLVCLIPKANTCLTKEIAFLDACLSDAYRLRVSVIFLEDALNAVERSIEGRTTARMQEHFRQFRQKYVPTFD